MVFALEKFRSYLVGSKVIVHTDHSALKYLMKKRDAKPYYDVFFFFKSLTSKYEIGMGLRMELLIIYQGSRLKMTFLSMILLGIMISLSSLLLELLKYCSFKSIRLMKNPEGQPTNLRTFVPNIIHKGWS